MGHTKKTFFKGLVPGNKRNFGGGKEPKFFSAFDDPPNWTSYIQFKKKLHCSFIAVFVVCIIVIVCCELIL